jgi:hypothetical protein
MAALKTADGNIGNAALLPVHERLLLEEARAVVLAAPSDAR